MTAKSLFIKKILIANRGEIACRIIRTAKRLGIHTISLYSDADMNAVHVNAADEAYYLGASAPAESYLNGEKILAIAKQAQVEAIHPGYGFLSENADFARLCEQASITFVGPSADAIDAMGNKSAAKVIMAAANVPLVPGYHGDEQSDDYLLDEANKIGYPLLIKAAWGGGGKGMRIVEAHDAALSAIHSTRREASSSFGNDKLLLEHYVPTARHVEVQIFADTHGHCIYLADRDCSIQRRHQKVIEEAPAPYLSDALRAKMGQTAVAAARAIDYRGAGTVEFLLDPQHRFYFMEMNTRLQVEHPVTEMVTGQDLVEWQLRVASGEALPLMQEQVRVQGHAFEARIYAEDPSNDFLPASGSLHFIREPAQSTYVRIDSGVKEQDVISNFYDPMIAKLIVWDGSRMHALQRLTHALESYQIDGVKHNIEFLANIAQHPAFTNDRFSTDFIERYLEELLRRQPHGLSPDLSPNLTSDLSPNISPDLSLCNNQSDSQLTAEDADKQIILALAALYQICLCKNTARAKASLEPNSPWNLASGFRLNANSQYHVTVIDEEHQIHALDITEIRLDDTCSYTVDIGERRITLSGELTDEILAAEISLETQSSSIEARSTGLTHTAGNHHAFTHKIRITVSQIDDNFTLFIGASNYHFRALQTQILDEQDASQDKLTAPMNGTIVTHLVSIGDNVASGQALMIMEAMKMEYTIFSPYDGIVTGLFFKPGELVSDGSLLVDIKPLAQIETDEA